MYGRYDQHSAEISRSQDGRTPSSHALDSVYPSLIGAGSVGSFSTGPRRQGQYRKQVIRLPDQPASQPRQVRVRLPTPEPDTLERV